jgi:hypothetical protein
MDALGLIEFLWNTAMLTRNWHVNHGFIFADEFSMPPDVLPVKDAHLLQGALQKFVVLEGVGMTPMFINMDEMSPQVANLESKTLSDLAVKYAEQLPPSFVEAACERLLGASDERSQSLALVLLKGKKGPLSSGIGSKLGQTLKSRNARIVAAALSVVCVKMRDILEFDLIDVVAVNLGHNERFLRDRAWEVLEQVCITERSVGRDTTSLS